MSKDKKPAFIQSGKEYENMVRFMIIMASHKIGKTSNLMQLPNSLNIDLEDSAGYFDGDHVNVQELCRKNPNIKPYKILQKVIKDIRESGVEYDFIILDTLTVLSDIAEDLAIDMHKATPKGEDFDDTNETLFGLDYGLGYDLHRRAMLKIIDDLKLLANKTLILTAHTKDGVSQTPKGEVVVQDINLVGKLKLILPSRVDANATMYVHPDDENKRMLSFKKHSHDIVTGTRVSHLAGREFLISERKNPNTPDEELVTYWDKIFLDLK